VLAHRGAGELVVPGVPLMGKRHTPFAPAA
jgi:hypothetical protein